MTRVVSGGSDNGTDTYSYDFENRLVGLVKGTAGGAGTYAYQYDYRTRRIDRNENGAGGANTSLVFSGGSSVQEYDGGAAPSVEYVRGSDYGGGVGGILYTVRSGADSYTHENRRGDVIAKTDGSGSLTYQAQYEGFGKQTQTSGSTLDRQKSNSKDTDPTGLVDEGFRYRDLETGMFLTRDPAGFVDGPNLYTYVVQNPWTSFDPEGLDTQNVSDNDVNAAVARAQAANPKEQGTLGSLVYTAAGRIIQFGANHQDSLKTTRSDIEVGMNVATLGVEGKAAATAGGLLDRAATTATTTATTATTVGTETTATATAVNAANKEAAAVTAPTQSAAQVTRANPQEIKYTQDSVSPTFSDGRTVQQTTADLKSGATTPDQIKPMNVVEQDGQLKSLDNRRLKAMKDAGVTDAPVVKKDLNDPAVQKEFNRKNTTTTNGESIDVRTKESQKTNQ